MRPGRLLATAAAILGVVAVAARAPGDDARYSSLLAWKTDHVTRVLALGYTDLGMNGRGPTEVRTIAGESCLVGPTVGFDVDDAYAFDVDEAVTVSVEYVTELTTAQAIVVLYDRNGGDGRGSVEIAPERTGPTARATVTRPRARLAGQGAQGVDIAIAGRQGLVGSAACGSRSRTRRAGESCRPGWGSTTRPAACRSRPTRRFPFAGSAIRSGASG
jgi:hypothetical protein